MSNWIKLLGGASLMNYEFSSEKKRKSINAAFDLVHFDVFESAGRRIPREKENNKPEPRRRYVKRSAPAFHLFSFFP